MFCQLIYHLIISKIPLRILYQTQNKYYILVKKSYILAKNLQYYLEKANQIIYLSFQEY